MQLVSISPDDQENIEHFLSLSPQVNKNLILWGFTQNARYWLVQSDNKVARISARIPPHTRESGTVGFFALSSDGADSIKAGKIVLEAAESWLKSSGATEIIGPIDHSTWFTYRFSLPEKNRTKWHQWEPKTPVEYYDLFADCGFKDFAYYKSVFYPIIRIGPFRIGEREFKKSYKHFLGQGFSMRPFDLNILDKEILPEIYSISHEAFADSLMFGPIDFATFSHLYTSALKVYDFSPSGLIIAPDGRVAGFLFAFYDNDLLVIKSIGLRKKYQGQKLSTGAIYSAIKHALPLKKKGIVSALVKSGLASESVSKKFQKNVWFTHSHHYVLMKKTL